MMGKDRICRIAFVGLLVAAAGCGPVQQIAPANRRIMQSLQTAVSSGKVEWLDATVKLMDEQRSRGELSDGELAAFQSIIDKARHGDWAAAQREAFALSEGQRATKEDLERIRPQGQGT